MRDEAIGIEGMDVSQDAESPAKENGHTGQARLRFSDLREAQNRGFPPSLLESFTRLGTIIGKKNGPSRRQKAESCSLGGMGLDDVEIPENSRIKIIGTHDHQPLSQVIA